MIGSIVGSSRSLRQIVLTALALTASLGCHHSHQTVSVPTARPAGSSWEILKTGLAHGDPSHRKQAVAAVASIGSTPEVVRLIEIRLDDSEAGVRQIAAEKLGEIDAKSAIPQLKKSLNDKDPAVGFAAAQSLWQLSSNDGEDFLLAVWDGRQAAHYGFVESEIRQAEKTLDNPEALAMLGGEQAAGFFLGPFSYGITIAQMLMKDRSLSSQLVAVALLSERPSPRIQNAMEDQLTNDNWVIRAAAARALGRTNRDAIPKLEPLLNDSTAAVRYSAAASIIRLERK